MAQQIARGATITLHAYTRDGHDDLANPDSIEVDILDVDGVEVVSGDVPTTHPATGHYTYAYAVASDADLGAWAIRWTVVFNGAPVVDEDGFTVLDTGSITTDPDHSYSGDPADSALDAVRFLLGDTADPWQSSNQEIDYMLGIYPDPAMAAAQLALNIAGHYTSRADKAIGPLSISYSKISDNWTARHKALLAQARANLHPAPWAGATNPLEMEATANDTTQWGPSRGFRVGEMDNRRGSIAFTEELGGV